MIRAAAAVIAVSLAGCSPGPAPQPDPQENAATLDRTYPGPDSLIGEWRLAGVDHRSVDLGWAITVSIDGGSIRLASQCLTPRWAYIYKGGKLTTRSLPEPVCERGRHPVENTAIAVFDAGGTVETTPESGVLISGAGHSITLFSQ